MSQSPATTKELSKYEDRISELETILERMADFWNKDQIDHFYQLDRTWVSGPHLEAIEITTLANQILDEVQQ